MGYPRGFRVRPRRLDPAWPQWFKERVKRSRRQRCAPYFYDREILKPRTRLWIDLVFERSLAVMAGTNRRIGVQTLEKIGAGALDDAGFQRNLHPLGKRRKAADLLGLPKVQEALSAKFSAAGLTVDRRVEIVAGIAEGKIGNDDQAVPRAALQLRALDMVTRLTTGYAPTKSGVLHAHTNADAFFEQESFENPPTIDTETGP